MKTKTYQNFSVLACALALSACTSVVSQGVNDKGMAEAVVFPEIKTAWNPDGIFPNVDNISKIAPGVTKDDLYYLLGRPHFKETHGAREWDYIFKFREHFEQPATTCQYKVIFDKDMIGRSFHWQPKSCGNGFYQTLATFSADALFPFNRSAPSDISAKGQSLLRDLAGTVKQSHADAQLSIVGHADYLGSSEYNQGLSVQRAQSVKDYLAQQGIPASKMIVSGKGENEPVVTCEDNGDRAALVNCLAPNRRVSIAIVPK